jgi:tetratricopeptide (TPR) repeat protein
MEKRTISIERNAIENFLMKVKEFVRHHRAHTLVITLVVVIGTALIMSGAVYYDYRSNRELHSYESIMNDYAAGPRDDAAFAAMISKLTVLVDSTLWGYVHAEGNYIAAGLYFEKKKFADAQKFYLKYADSSSSVLAPLALFQAGICAEDLGKFDQAFEIYKRIEKEYKDSLFADRVLYDVGRMYQKKGDSVNAREYFNKLQTQFPGSPYNSLAKVRVFLLGIAK